MHRFQCSAPCQGPPQGRCWAPPEKGIKNRRKYNARAAAGRPPRTEKPPRCGNSATHRPSLGRLMALWPPWGHSGPSGDWAGDARGGGPGGPPFSGLTPMHADGPRGSTPNWLPPPPPFRWREEGGARLAQRADRILQHARETRTLLQVPSTRRLGRLIDDLEAEGSLTFRW